MRSGSQRVVQLPPTFVERLVEWALRAAPREACGLFTGVADASRVVVTGVHLAQNLARRPDRFELDPGTLVRVDREAEERGEAVLAVWHSHPDRPAALSPLDRAGVPSVWDQAVLGLADPAAPELAWFEEREGAWSLLTRLDAPRRVHSAPARGR